MREIKFRGKCPFGWVYGCLNYDASKNTLIRTEDFTSALYVVNPETVAQYTGLKDKNGKEIYECDIVKANNNKDFYKIYWEDYRFTIEDKWGNRIKPLQRAIDHFECDVVGNVYDNPELLEEMQCQDE